MPEDKPIMMELFDFKMFLLFNLLLSFSHIFVIFLKPKFKIQKAVPATLSIRRFFKYCSSQNVKFLPAIKGHL